MGQFMTLLHILRPSLVKGGKIREDIFFHLCADDVPKGAFD